MEVREYASFNRAIRLHSLATSGESPKDNYRQASDILNEINPVRLPEADRELYDTVMEDLGKKHHLFN